MNIYWSQKQIPALKGLSRQERKDAVRRVAPAVWTHWQVWGAALIQVSAFLALVFLVPPFSYRLLVAVVFAFITATLAALPFHHYLNQHLTQNGSES